MGALLSHQELIEESQRLRHEFDQNVIKLRVTLERTKAVAGEKHLLDALTPREVEVLRLVAEGKSSKEIAVQLGIAFRTAVCHRYRIFQKLNVHEVASVVRLAVRAGLIQP